MVTVFLNFLFFHDGLLKSNFAIHHLAPLLEQACLEKIRHHDLRHSSTSILICPPVPEHSVIAKLWPSVTSRSRIAAKLLAVLMSLVYPTLSGSANRDDSLEFRHVSVNVCQDTICSQADIHTQTPFTYYAILLYQNSRYSLFLKWH